MMAKLFASELCEEVVSERSSFTGVRRVRRVPRRVVLQVDEGHPNLRGTNATMRVVIADDVIG